MPKEYVSNVGKLAKSFDEAFRSDDYVRCPLCGEAVPIGLHGHWTDDNDVLGDFDGSKSCAGCARALRVDIKNGLVTLTGERPAYYRKYTVFKNPPVGANTTKRKEVHTALFILDRRDPAALCAVIEYARVTSDRDLAFELLHRVRFVLREDPYNGYREEIKWDKSNVTPQELEQMHKDAIRALNG